MSISFRLRPATLLLAGALLVPSAVFAQEGTPSIVPTDNPTAPVPAPVVSPATVPTNSQPIIDSMTFTDVDVTELLSMISTTFDVPIAIAGDVTGKLRSINIKGRTAEQAINTVIQAAQLSAQKTADGTYIISKAPQAPAPSAEPAISVGVPTIAPANGFGGNLPSNNNGVLGAFGASPNAMFSTGPEELALVPTGKGVDSQERTFTVPIRNVKASMMAYWIDPANHDLPVDLRIAKELDKQYNNRQLVTSGISGGKIIGGDNQTGQGDAFSQPFNTEGVVPNPNASNPYISSSAEMITTRSNAQFGRGGQGGQGRGGQNGGGVGGRGGQGGGTFQLPEGVTRIVAVDPQNALLVFGTPEGAAKLANTIRFLDRPLRQVEIEAQFLSISTSDASNYGFDFSTSRGNFSASSTGNAASSGGLQLGFFRGNFDARIAASVASGKAKVLTAPRVTAINNLTASLTQVTQIPIRLNTNTTIANNGIANQNSESLFFISTTIGLQVTPTINNDDTVTVLMQPTLTTAGTPNSDGDQTFTQQTVQTIANVRDGETIALGGLRSTNITIDKTKVPLIGDIPLIGKLFRSRGSSAVESELIIFLTARIIRRVGDDDAVGTSDIPVGIGGQ